MESDAEFRFLGTPPSLPALCRGWPASDPGRLPPDPWFLTGVSAETPLDFDCQAARGSVMRCDQAVASS